MTIPQSLIEIVQSLSSAEGYYAVTNDIFKGYSEFEILAAAKVCGVWVEWSKYKQCMVVVPN